MLSITTKSPYALRALTELARIGAESPVPIGELARRREIPVQFLEQLDQGQHGDLGRGLGEGVPTLHPALGAQDPGAAQHRE